MEIVRATRVAKGCKCALWVALALGAMPFAGAADSGERPRDTAKIVSRAELDAYLAATPDNPFDAFSPGARERFLASLYFSEAGLATMDPNELADELDDAQIHAVLTLFGERVLDYAPKSRVQEIRAVERHVTKRPGMGALERQYTDFYIAMRDIGAPEDEVRARQLGELFDARLAPLYTPAALRRIDDHELRLLRLAVRNVSLTTRQPRHVEAFERLFAERVRRSIITTDDLSSLRDLFLALHRFADARKITSEHRNSEIESLPQFRDPLGKDAAGATVWRLDASGRRLTRAAVDLAPLQIFVAASCHLSRDAARDISADPLLGPLFEKHAQWLVRAPGIEKIEDARTWNAELPRAPVAMVYDREEWGFLPHWNMPTFFFVRDGKVVDSEGGWAHGDAQERAELIAALRRNGMLQ